VDLVKTEVSEQSVALIMGMEIISQLGAKLALTCNSMLQLLFPANVLCSLWGTTLTLKIEILECFQSKVLRMIVNAP
jgi:hypothetical protein